MSTYAIADAIEKFANNFKYTIEARNQIEKEKLAFEKEKLEYYKAIEEEKFKLNKPKKDCNHNWIIEVRKSDYIDEYHNEYCVVHQYCCECGATDVRMQPIKT